MDTKLSIILAALVPISVLVTVYFVYLWATWRYEQALASAKRNFESSLDLTHEHLKRSNQVLISKATALRLTEGRADCHFDESGNDIVFTEEE